MGRRGVNLGVLLWSGLRLGRIRGLEEHRLAGQRSARQALSGCVPFRTGERAGTRQSVPTRAFWEYRESCRLDRVVEGAGCRSPDCRAGGFGTGLCRCQQCRCSHRAGVTGPAEECHGPRIQGRGRVSRPASRLGPRRGEAIRGAAKAGRPVVRPGRLGNGPSPLGHPAPAGGRLGRRGGRGSGPTKLGDESRRGQK